MERGELLQAEISTRPKVPWFPWIGKKRPFYGWVIVASGTLAWFANNFPTQTLPSYLAFFQKEFGWSRAILAGVRSLQQLENAVLGPIEGILVDRFGSRIVVAFGIFILGLGLIFFSFINSVWMYYGAEVIILLGGGLVSPFIVSVCVNHWFRRKRSMVNGIIGLGLAMATVLGVPAIVFIQNTLGWRTALIITGFVVWIAGIPAILFFRRSPETYGLQMDGDIAGVSSPGASTRASSRAPMTDEFDFTLREALRTKVFWFIAVGQAFAGLGMGGIQIHLFLHLEQVGLDRSMIALIVSITGLANMTSRLIGGYLGDHMPKRLIIGSCVVFTAISIFVLAYATSLPMALAYAVLYGLGWGARVPVVNAMKADYFGRKAQGTIRGWNNVVSAPFSLAAPIVAGLVADVQGTYRGVFVIMGAIVLVGAAVLFLAAPPKIPHREGAISG